MNPLPTKIKDLPLPGLSLKEKGIYAPPDFSTGFLYCFLFEIDQTSGTFAVDFFSALPINWILKLFSSLHRLKSIEPLSVKELNCSVVKSDFPFSASFKIACRASLVAQWLRICLLMQGTRVRALVWEDPTCRGAAGPVSHNYWACASGACAPQQERPR